MLGKYVVLVNGKIETYTNFDDIPEVIDNVIEFLPEYPKGPHTDHEHEEMEQFTNKLQELLKRETNGR